MGPVQGALTPDNGNSAINSLYVLQFHAKSDGSYGTLRRVAEGELSSGGVYKATLQQSNDTDDLYLLVILANFGTSPDLYSLAGKTYEQVQKACYSALSSGILTFGASDVIPMSGVVNRGQPVRVEKGETYSGIQLLRAVARVDVGIGTPVDGSNTWNPGTVDFRMTDIQVWKAGRRYTRLPLAHTYSAAGVPSVSEPSVVPGVEVASPWDYNAGISGNTVKGGWCVSSIFLPETKLKGTDASPNKVFDANHTNRLAIIVGGYYPAASTEKSWYRIDICDGNSTPETVMNLDILRNTIYSISIGRVTAKGYASAQQAYEKKPLGLGFTAGVKPWLTGITMGLLFLCRVSACCTNSGRATEGPRARLPGWCMKMPLSGAGVSIISTELTSHLITMISTARAPISITLMKGWGATTAISITTERCRNQTSITSDLPPSG